MIHVDIHIVSVIRVQCTKCFCFKI